MEQQQFIEAVRQRAGLEKTEQAEGAVEAVLAVVGHCLADYVVRAVAHELPRPVGRILRESRYEGPLPAAKIYERVRLREGLSRGFAAEHTQVVCQVVADALQRRTRELLRSSLPDELAEVVAAREQPTGRVPPYRRPRRPASPESTLAGGRPGSRHPISEDTTEGGHPDSVWTTENPHGDTKISTSRGLSSERREETISTGRPGSHRPLSGDEEED